MSTEQSIQTFRDAYTRLRDDPFFRALHTDSRVKAMLERGGRWLADMKASRKP